MYIDDGVADLQHVNSRIQVSKYTQLGCFADPEPSTGAVEHHGFPQEEPLEARGVHHGDAVDCGQADLHAPEVLADEAEARHVLSGSHYAQVLQDGAPGEEVLHVAALHLHGAEDELAEAREHRGSATVWVWQRGGAREFPEAEVKAGERGDVEKHGGERHVERPRAVDEDELLHAFGGERLDPARELPLAGGAGVVAADEVDGAEGSGVRGDGAGDGGGERRRVGARGLAEAALEEAREVVRVGEGERRAARDGAPAAGEHGGARGVLGGEAGDDVAEEPEGEGTDAVVGVAGGGGERGEGGAGVDGRVGEAHVEELEEVLRGLLQHVRVHAAAASVGCSGGVEVDEWRGVLVGHGRRRRWRR